MPREIVFKVRRDGGIETDFTGFPGEECIGEAEKLQRALAGLGLKLELADFALKPPEMIAAELGRDEPRAAGRRGPREV